MKLAGIAMRNIKRKKGKAAFLVAGLAIGVATVMAIVSISAAMKTEIAKKLDEYGANIIVVPESNDLTVSYGGFVVAGMSLEERELDEKAHGAHPDGQEQGQPERAGAEALRRGAGGGAPGGGRRGRFRRRNCASRRWWELMGEKPAGPDDLLLGYQAALKLNKTPGDSPGHRGQTAAGGGRPQGDRGLGG